MSLKIIIYKSAKRLECWMEDTLQKTYEIAIGKKEVGHKEFEGDMKTPEGEYKVVVKNPHSKYHLSFGISYPNQKDALTALENKMISREEYETIAKADKSNTIPPWKTKIGGEIYVHGHLEKQRWSQGCIRMYDKDIEELYEAVEIGTLVVIKP